MCACIQPGHQAAHPAPLLLASVKSMFTLKACRCMNIVDVQENLPVPMKEVYTRAELLECRIAHSKQLHRVQIAFEARLQILNEYWKVSIWTT